MSKIINFSAILLSLAAVILGCEKYVNDFEFDEKSPRLVVNAILHPDSIIKVNITSSKTYNPHREITYVNEAEVLIYEDDNPLSSPKSIGNGYYVIENQHPTPGSTYKIEVRADGFETAKATTILPMPIDFSVTSRGIINKPVEDCPTCPPEKNAQYTLDLNLNNHTQWFGISVSFGAPVLDYFNAIMECVEVISTHDDGSEFIYDSCFQIYDTLGLEQENLAFHSNNRTIKFIKDWGDYVIDDYDYDNYASRAYCSTENESSSTLQFNMDISRNYRLDESQSREVEFVVNCYDESLFRFMYSLAQQEAVDGDPFAEKIQIYSNIENGLGIFGSMTPSSVTEELDPEFVRQ